MMSYSIKTISGKGLPADVDADGYTTHAAAEAMAEAHHDGDFEIVDAGRLEIRWDSGKRQEVANILEARGDVRMRHPGAVFHTDADRTLAWATEEDAQNDDGARAVAEIVRVA